MVWDQLLKQIALVDENDEGWSSIDTFVDKIKNIARDKSERSQLVREFQELTGIITGTHAALLAKLRHDAQQVIAKLLEQRTVAQLSNLRVLAAQLDRPHSLLRSLASLASCSSNWKWLLRGTKGPN